MAAIDNAARSVEQAALALSVAREIMLHNEEINVDLDALRLLSGAAVDLDVALDALAVEINRREVLDSLGVSSNA